MQWTTLIIVYIADLFHPCITYMYENYTFAIHKVMWYLQTPLENLLPDHDRRALQSLKRRTVTNKKIWFHVTQHCFLYDTYNIKVPVLDDWAFSLLS